MKWASNKDNGSLPNTRTNAYTMQSIHTHPIIYGLVYWCALNEFSSIFVYVLFWLLFFSSSLFYVLAISQLLSFCFVLFSFYLVFVFLIVHKFTHTPTMVCLVVFVFLRKFIVDYSRPKLLSRCYWILNFTYIDIVQTYIQKMYLLSY